MSRHLLFVLLPLLVLIGCTCGPACADRTVRPKNGVDLFVAKETKIPEKVDKTGSEKTFDSFISPLLVAADGVMVALAEARSPAEKDGHMDIGVAARYIVTQGEDWARKATEGNEEKWMTQLAIDSKKVEKDKYNFSTRTLLSVAKENKIYLFTVSLVPGESNPNPKSKVDFELAVGKVTGSESNPEGKTIKWEKLEDASKQLTKQFQDLSLTLSSSPGYAFLAKDEEIVFVIGVEKQKDQTVAAIIRSKGKEEEPKWELAYVKTSGGCSSFSFLEWNGKLIMIPTSCVGDYGGDRETKESADMGATWTDAKGPSSRLWGNMRDRRDLTTVTIDNRTLLLFTYLSEKVEGTKTAHELHLGFTDGHRLHDVGFTVTDDHEVFPGDLLYTNGELFFLHQQWTNVPGSITVTRITDKLASIKSVLEMCAENDKYFSKTCEETAPEGAPVGTPCVTPMPTDGLVGFFSNTASEDTWQDKYLYLNATVKGGRRVDNGFVFHGTNAGARWTVRYQGFGNRYNFAKHGLTVVATVTVHEVPKDDTPLLTFGGIGTRRFGLWYTGDKKWKVRSEGAEGATHAGSLATNEAYRVALVLGNGDISAYVDGNPVEAPPKISEHQGGLLNVADVFIGSYKDVSMTRVNAMGEEMRPDEIMPDMMLDGVLPGRGMHEGLKDRVSHVTVTNVLLYNRPLSEAELKTLNRRTVGKPNPGNTGDGNQQLSGGDGSNQQGTVDAQKKNSAQKMTGLGDGSVHVPAAGVLLFVLSLWGVFGLC